MPVKHRHTPYVRNAVAGIKEYLEKHSLEYNTCDNMLCFLTTVNRKVLEEAFKDIYGYTIKEYQLKLRLTESKNFLIIGRPLKWVAAACLYRSQSAFSTAFKKHYYISPAAWVKMMNSDAFIDPGNKIGSEK